jgi:D-alanyl-D-alanine carboxypeptidase
MKFFYIKKLFFFFFIFGTFWAKSQPFDPTLAALLQQRIDSLQSAYQIKGLSSAVFIPSQGYWMGTSGISYTNSPIGKDMLFGIGSNTKLFTSVCLLKLMENDTSIQLENKISKWLPAIKNVNPNITITQLLNHTSGIADIIDFPGYADSISKNPLRVFQPEELLPYIGTPIFQPGKGTFYSNTNYTLAGLIFQKASNQSLANYMRSNVLNSLQLDSTFFDVYETIKGEVAHPWQNGKDIDGIPRISLNSAAWSAGAMYSTASEMAQWYKYLLIDKKVLKPNSFVNLVKFSPPGNYGLGIGQQVLNNRVVWGHGGDIRGYRSRFLMDTASQTIVVVLTNSNPLEINNVAGSILNLVTSYNVATSLEKTENLNSKIDFFPNPAQHTIRIENVPEETIYEIFNPLGQSMLKGITSGTIELASIPPGVYNLVLNTSPQFSTLRLVKNE